MAKGKNQIKDMVASWGSPEAIAAEFRTLKRSAHRLSSNNPRLIDEYPNQWVAIYRGEVCAHADTFQAVVKSVKKQGWPLSRMIIRYISKYRRAMFL